MAERHVLDNVKVVQDLRESVEAFLRLPSQVHTTLSIILALIVALALIHHIGKRPIAK